MIEQLATNLVATPHSLFVIVDGARDRGVSVRVKALGLPYQSLYEGAVGAELAPYGPYLVQLPKDASALLGWLNRSWGKAEGVFLAAEAPPCEIRRHLRRCLIVELRGRPVYFRFYDPRVLRRFLPECTHDEWIQFFGPIATYLTEADDASSLLRFRRDAETPEPEQLNLQE